MFKFAKHKQEITVSENAVQAREFFSRALELIGRVNRTELFDNGMYQITGKTSYGWQQVPVMITLPEKNSGKDLVVSVEAKSDDIHGEAAKESIKHLLDVYAALSTGNTGALNSLAEKNNFAGGMGMTKSKFFIRLALVIFVSVCVGVVLYRLVGKW